jgi:hypothetical protein
MSKKDMNEVINFLSGQTYDKKRLDIVQEILTNDFEIKFDEGEDNDNKKRTDIRDKKKCDIIANMWEKIKAKCDFRVMLNRNLYSIIGNQFKKRAKEVPKI